MISIKIFSIKSTQKIQNINQHASVPCGGASNINQNSRAIPPPPLPPNHPKKKKTKKNKLNYRLQRNGIAMYYKERSATCKLFKQISQTISSRSNQITGKRGEGELHLKNVYIILNFQKPREQNKVKGKGSRGNSHLSCIITLN